MQNFVNYTNEAQITATTTMGYLPGNLYPTQLLLCNAAAGITVNLPPVQSYPATLPPGPPTYGQPSEGVSGGFRITIFNQSGSGTVTVSPNGTDTIIGSANLAATANVKVTLQASPLLSAWVVVG